LAFLYHRCVSSAFTPGTQGTLAKTLQALTAPFLRRARTRRLRARGRRANAACILYHGELGSCRQRVRTVSMSTVSQVKISGEIYLKATNQNICSSELKNIAWPRR
jgi:hypothetical protein